MSELDLLLLLLLAHVLGDFYLQPLSWVKDRLQWHFKSPKLQLHVSVHMGLSLAVILAWQWLYGWSHDSLMAVALALVIGLSHYLIDVAKSYSSNGLMAFLLDQLAHLAVLLLLWSAYTANWQWWPVMLPQNSAILLLAYLLVLTPSSVLIGQLLRSWRPVLNTRIALWRALYRYVGTCSDPDLCVARSIWCYWFYFGRQSAIPLCTTCRRPKTRN
ncbi:MAG: DUF3307 domain-containing protein [Rheinheimera sp.]|nr:DUF3307 domain-containing protein [Rheinheimera sp.]